MSNGDGSNAVLRPFGIGLFQAAVLVLLFCVAALLEALRFSSLRNYDIWEHLRVGSWMLANKTWPTAGLFSQAANFSWRDFNWAGDVAMATAYRVLGLSALPAMWMLYRFLLAVVTFFLAGGTRGKFWLPVALSAVAQYLLSALGPVAGGNSAIFFAVELFFLMEYRRTGKFRRPFYLPLLFVLWANVDWDFVYGIGLLAVFLAALTAEKFVLKNNSKQVDGRVRARYAALAVRLLRVLHFFCRAGQPSEPLHFRTYGDDVSSAAGLHALAIDDGGVLRAGFAAFSRSFSLDRLPD
jgi:hypothetical protein